MFKKILAVLAMLAVTTLAMARVDVNKATEAELDSVKGIGPGTSKAILEERKKGNFKSWDDFISRVKGVGESRAANLSEAGLRVNGRTFQATSARKDDAKSDKAGKAEAKADAKAKDAKAEAKAEKKEAKAETKADAKAEAKAPAAAASARK